MFLQKPSFTENRSRIEIRLRLISILSLGRYRKKNVYNCKKTELYEDELLLFIIHDRNTTLSVNLVCIEINSKVSCVLKCFQT